MTAAENSYRRQLRSAKRAHRKCLGCGALFKRRRSNQRYHSLACKQKAYRLRSGRAKQAAREG